MAKKRKKEKKKEGRGVKSTFIIMNKHSLLPTKRNAKVETPLNHTYTCTVSVQPGLWWEFNKKAPLFNNTRLISLTCPSSPKRNLQNRNVVQYRLVPKFIV